MRTILLLSILRCASSSNLLNEDYIHWFLNTHPNHKIHPCDNFYRHVCPVGISADETLTQVMTQRVMRSFKEGRQYLEREEPEIVELMNALIIEQQKSILAILAKPISAHDQKVTMDNNHFQLTQEFNNDIEDLLKNYAKELLLRVPSRIALMTDLRNNPQNPLRGANFTRILQITRDMRNLIVKKAQNSDQYSPAFNRYIEGVINRINITTALLHETDETIQLYKEILKLLSGSSKQFVCNGHIASCLQMTRDLRNPTNISIYALLSMSGVSNSWNDEDSVTLGETMFLLSFMRRTSLSTVIGQYGYVLAHEIGHSLIKKPSLENNAVFSTDITFVKQMECVRRMMEKSCILWGETKCGSGNLTMKEDGPDVFAVSSAYELLEHYLGSSMMDEIEYDDLSITKEQLFFYSTAILWCKSYIESQHKDRDVHSNELVRINAVFSMMPEFHKAFKCKKHQIMVQPDRCTFYDSGKATTKVDDANRF